MKGVLKNYMKVRELPEKVTVKSRLTGSKRGSTQISTEIEDRRNGGCKGPEAGMFLKCLRNSKEA